MKQLRGLLWACYLSLVLGLFTPCMAQVNLVPNPAFELYKQCPNNMSGSVGNSQPIQFFLYDWYSGGIRASWAADYYNNCARDSMAGVPFNYRGFQFPKSGNAYIGFIARDSAYQFYPPIASFGSQTGIFCRLSEALKPGSTYHIKFSVVLADYSNSKYNLSGWNAMAVHNIGMYLTNHKIDSGINNYFTKFTDSIPQIKNDENVFLDDTLNWMQIADNYIAKGGEEWIAIGAFNNTVKDKEWKKICAPPNVNNNSYIGFSAYYYLDDISIVLLNEANTIKDTTICFDDSLSLNKRINYDSCIWNDGDTNSMRIFKTEGKYWVTNLSASMNVTDTFIIHYLNIPSTSNDTAICEEEPILLTGGNAQQYLWNTTDSIQSILVHSAGLYWVQKTIDGCAGLDSFNVLQYRKPVIRSLKDTTVCFDEVAQILLDAGQFKSYLWKPTRETTRTIYSNTAQVYLLSVTDSNNCSTRKQVAVMETCPEFVFIPNAFTPNGDGLNDVFLPQTRNLVSYEMSILNRWGEIIFKTKNPQQGWDGKDAQADTYVVLINYKVDGKELQSVKQNVSLLR